MCGWWPESNGEKEKSSSQQANGGKDAIREDAGVPRCTEEARQLRMESELSPATFS